MKYFWRLFWIIIILLLLLGPFGIQNWDHIKPYLAKLTGDQQTDSINSKTAGLAESVQTKSTPKAPVTKKAEQEPEKKKAEKKELSIEVKNLTSDGGQIAGFGPAGWEVELLSNGKVIAKTVANKEDGRWLLTLNKDQVVYGKNTFTLSAHSPDKVETITAENDLQIDIPEPAKQAEKPETVEKKITETNQTETAQTETPAKVETPKAKETETAKTTKPEITKPPSPKKDQDKKTAVKTEAPEKQEQKKQQTASIPKKEEPEQKTRELPTEKKSEEPVKSEPEEKKTAEKIEKTTKPAQEKKQDTVAFNINDAQISNGVKPKKDLSLKGQAKPGSKVKVYVNGKLIGTAKAQKDGTWKFTQSLIVDKLQQQVKVEQLDEKGKILAAREQSVSAEHLVEEVPVKEKSAATETRSASVTGTLKKSLSKKIRTVRGGYHVVVVGDSLWGIAVRNYGNGMFYWKIYHANSRKIKDVDLIYPGQKFKIP